MVQLDKIMEMANGQESTPKPRNIPKTFHTPDLALTKPPVKREDAVLREISVFDPIIHYNQVPKSPLQSSKPGTVVQQNQF